jgi:hypothetical protein
MQSENGILVLFYIFLSHGNKKKNEKKRGVKRGKLCPVHKPVLNTFELKYF